MSEKAIHHRLRHPRDVIFAPERIHPLSESRRRCLRIS
jgi:hypothetical protein